MAEPELPPSPLLWAVGLREDRFVNMWCHAVVPMAEMIEDLRRIADGLENGELKCVYREDEPR